MKMKYSLLGASIALALTASPLLARADTANSILASLHTTEAPRITTAVNTNDLVRIPKTHMTFAVAPSSAIPDTATMNHLQLVLQPSAQRQAALKQLIAEQHDPKSPGFHQWITPEQYGANFGVAAADIATVTAWLQSQGFTVNNVYPNDTEIDFSGTAGQVRTAFHTQENLYTLHQKQLDGTTNTVTHLSNNSDISIPAALQGVVAGVMGLNDFHAQPLARQPHVMKWNAATRSYQPTAPADIRRQQVLQQMARAGGKSQGTFQPSSVGVRGLTPYDLNQMYDVSALLKAGITGKGVTIAVVDVADMVPADWTNFVSTFGLGQYGGTFAQVNPAPPSGTTNCMDTAGVDFTETLLDAEWATAMAPGANIVVATCSGDNANGSPATSNFFGGAFVAATNLINQSSSRPDIISASYGFGESFVGPTSKTAIDAMWAQADAEGISVFVATGDSSANPSFNGGVINSYYGNSALDANAMATSPYDTGVGGNDTADVLDGTSSKYFASTPNTYGGTALGYVPEIPWNQSCGNGVAAAAMGYSSALAFCQTMMKLDYNGYTYTSEGGSGGRSSYNAKPAWQAGVYDAAPDGVRDLPDVSLFAGSYGGYTWVIICTAQNPCALSPSGEPTVPMSLEGGTSLASPMFAGIQALVDQALGSNGAPADQGNAASTLYALADQEYGTSTTPNNTGLASCASNDNGNPGNTGCVFHNIVRGDISSNCYQMSGFTTANCYYYGVPFIQNEPAGIEMGLTSNDAAPTSYTLTNRAYTTRPGWSLASGLGSVDAANLVAAWQKYNAASSSQ